MVHWELAHHLSNCLLIDISRQQMSSKLTVTSHWHVCMPKTSLADINHLFLMCQWIPGWAEGSLLLHDNYAHGCHSWDPPHHHHQVVQQLSVLLNHFQATESQNLLRPGLANTEEELHHQEGRNTTTTDTLLDLLTNCFPPNLVQVKITQLWKFLIDWLCHFFFMSWPKKNHERYGTLNLFKNRFPIKLSFPANTLHAIRNISTKWQKNYNANLLKTSFATP